MNRRILAAALATTVSLGMAGTALAPAQAASGKDWTQTTSQSEDGGHWMGNPDAELQLQEFVSYTCIHCAHFTQESDVAMRLGYVHDGKVRIEVRHLIRDPIDMTIALLTNCGDQTKFFGNHRAFFNRYDDYMDKARAATPDQIKRWNDAPLDSKFKLIADDLGLYGIMEARGFARAQLDRCLSDEAKTREIARQSAAGMNAYKIKGTPSFVLNGKLLPDAHSWDTLKPELDDTLGL
ncbi:protein-disulfide isomerase [Altericroceibacterium spongiae]|uniref:Protein-disulfide isomerase n=1 Tax=Altericroceibacterium spongiae TaxID=2320269 RepID=A0A420EK91_9SPHN|nr:thioredoxin domain-containing protein [Altericroceibacterium spongiae]RKF21016.1 protein-disulfide isomerase [Altericroceibacterium spongiae]